MSESANNRQFARYDLPASALMTAFAEVPISVEDICAGGFRVVVPKEPEDQRLGIFSLILPDMYLGDFLGQVA